jgi:hypothetical protein
VIGCSCLALWQSYLRDLPIRNHPAAAQHRFLWAGRRLIFCFPLHKIMPDTLVHYYHPLTSHNANPKHSTSVHTSVTNNLNCKNRFLATCLMLVSSLAYSSTLKMEETCQTETSVDFQRITRCYIPEDRSLHNHSERASDSKCTYFVLCP